MEQPFIETQLNTFEGVPVRLGIDEAGRGPVLGHLNYACFYCPYENELLLKELEVDDSKKLTEDQRHAMYKAIKSRPDAFGYMVHGTPPQHLSACMLRRNKYNLNEISHDTAMWMIRQVQAAGVNVKQVFVDTVGRPGPYQTKLQAAFPTMEVTVAEKADSLYPVVSAASICAKVTRDRLLKEWRPDTALSSCSSSEPPEVGSGYPGGEPPLAPPPLGAAFCKRWSRCCLMVLVCKDPSTKKFLDDHFDKLFGYPTLVRFSWATAKDRIANDGHAVDWFDADEENKKSGVGEDRGAQSSIRSFFGVNKVMAQTSRKTGNGGASGNEIDSSRPVKVLPRSLRFLSRNRLQAVTEFY
eukprot:GHVS01067065.1.p1 GENE.GHVS01067065.1~~GHVS01067065.1.p1  ORF type:complete len:355 (-),score=46.72 GHVS01067065.1:14-1078(-)